MRRRSPEPATPARRPRTYVVFGYPLPIEPREPVTIVGTVQATDRRAARPLAFALARKRGHRPSGEWVVRWWVTSVCRPAWLVEALARDGAAALAAERA